MALAWLLGETRHPPAGLWAQPLDALHLATVLYLRSHGQPVALASYDLRLVQAAAAQAIPLAVDIG